MLILRVATLVVAGAFAVTDWWAVGNGRPAVERFAKPLATAAVLPVGLAFGLLDRPWAPAVVIGLALGLVGDILLLGHTQARFLAGLSAFLVGRVAYVWALMSMGGGFGAWFVLAAVVLLGCLGVARNLLPTLWRDGGVGSAGPVAAYMLVLVVMTLLSGWTGRPWVALGGALFAVSDTVLARDRFLVTDPTHRTHLLVMVTYLLAQLMLVLGLAQG